MITPIEKMSDTAGNSTETAKSTQITHVIFDLDGLLLDTESIYSECTNSILARFNKNFPMEVKTKMMGRPRHEGAKILIDALELPLTPEQLVDELYELLFQRFPHAKLLPGAVELVQHFHKHNIPIAIATGSHQEAYDSKMSSHPEITQCLSHAVCSDNPLIKKGKPAPDIFLLTANQFSNPPQSMDQVVVFEDSPLGIEAAKAAGMFAVMVPDKFVSKDATRLADRVLSSLKDVNLPELGLPPLLKN